MEYISLSELFNSGSLLWLREDYRWQLKPIFGLAENAENVSHLELVKVDWTHVQTDHVMKNWERVLLMHQVKVQTIALSL